MQVLGDPPAFEIRGLDRVDQEPLHLLLATVDAVRKGDRQRQRGHGEQDQDTQGQGKDLPGEGLDVLVQTGHGHVHLEDDRMPRGVPHPRVHLDELAGRPLEVVLGPLQVRDAGDHVGGPEECVLVGIHLEGLAHEGPLAGPQDGAEPAACVAPELHVGDGSVAGPVVHRLVHPGKRLRVLGVEPLIRQRADDRLCHRPRGGLRIPERLLTRQDSAEDDDPRDACDHGHEVPHQVPAQRSTQRVPGRGAVAGDHGRS